MSGTNVDQVEGQGINYRALEDLFSLVEERKGEVGMDMVDDLKGKMGRQGGESASSLSSFPFPVD